MSTIRGFFSLLAILLVVIVAFIAIAATGQFTSDARTAADQLAANQAFYLALSGIELAKHTIATNYTACESINGQSGFTNVALGKGEFTVIGNDALAATTLASSISSSSTTVPLTSTQNFAAAGVVQIDEEWMSYDGISGNNLLNVIRGIGDSLAVSHSSGSNVTQNQCLITAQGGVPSLTTPYGKRTMATTLPGYGFALGLYNTHLLIPALTAVGTVTLKNNSDVINSAVTAQSNNFPGAAIVSGSSISLSGAATTKVNSTGGLVVSSHKNQRLADSLANYTGINASTLFNVFFTQSQSTIKSFANRSYTSLTLNGATGKTIWMNNSLDMLTSATIGSATNPVILIVAGNVNFYATVTLYGFLYATGAVDLESSTHIIGAVASEKTVILSNDATIEYDPTILTRLNILNSNTTFYFDPVAARWEEGG